jgi:hypothetical protein
MSSGRIRRFADTTRKAEAGGKSVLRTAPIFCAMANRQNAGTGMAGSMTSRKQPARKKAGNRSVKRVNKQAFTAVDRNAESLAATLLDAATKGDMHCAKLLMQLAEEKEDQDKGAEKRPLLELIKRLEQEPQAQAEMAEENLDKQEA